MGVAVFGEEDPVGIFYRGRPYTVRREGDGFALELELPFTSRDEVRLTRFGDEMVIQVAAWRRNLILPRALLDAPTTGGAFHDHILRIEFGPPPRVAAEAAKGA